LLLEATIESRNSLNRIIHPVFDPKKAIKGIVSDGYGVDHVFYKNCNLISCIVDEHANISDHLPVLAIFEI
jgi:endonuclease/exonuclease/phosphatase (EEP) superfamily protein YafD